MELRVLRYFLAVAREGNISAAAANLHITQPTLSRQLIDLEHELGAQLLVRGGRNQGISLTEKGQLLRRRAEELIDLADKTQLEMNHDDYNISGTVSIGGGETGAMRIIARTAKALQKKYPDIRYHLYSGNAADVKERLDKGLIDFGVFIEPADIQKYDHIRLLATDVWGLLVRKDHPLATRSSILASDLQGIPLFISQQRFTDIAAWLGYDPSHLNVVLNYNLVYNAALMVDEGLGCALTIDKLVNTTANSNLHFIPLEPRLEAHLDIAWKKYQVFGKASELFLEHLKSICADALEL